MKCPRCDGGLTALEVGPVEVYPCSNCEGCWYPDEALAEVTDRSFGELKEGALGPTLVPDQLAKVDLDAAVSCPACSQEMSRYTYSAACPIVLDECPRHGVWLDDGELGTLMQYLVELDKRVGEQQHAVLTARNLSTLAELSKSPSYHSLPSGVLSALNTLHRGEKP